MGHEALSQNALPRIADVNSYVTVTLTRQGAEILNRRGEKINAKFKKASPWRTNYKAGDKMRDQFWYVVGSFPDNWAAGKAAPFTNLTLEQPS